MIKRDLFIKTALIFIATICISTTAAYAQTMVDGGRLSGKDRYETSVNISKTGWKDGSDYVIMATGLDYPDALSATPLAKKLNAPILLTAQDKLNPIVDKELERLSPSTVYIIGGEKAVSSGIVNTLKNRGIECIRLSGNDRYETSLKVAEEVGQADKVVIATGTDFADALSIAPWAASNGIPILLTGSKSMTEDIRKYANRDSVTSSYVIGGKKAIEDSVMNKLKNPTRIEGSNRFETNIAVLKKFSGDFNMQDVYIATGLDFPDALSGSALAAMTQSPIILASKEPTKSAKEYIDMNLDKIRNVYILGGEKVLPDNVVKGITPPIFVDISLSLSRGSILSGETAKASANAVMIPKDAEKPTITYASSDESIATVTQDGIVTGVGDGNVKIMATYGGKYKEVNLYVKQNKIIVIDPGHGGSAVGTRTPESGKWEKDLTLATSTIIYNKLVSQGYTVIMTRYDDSFVELSDRTKIANDANADLFLSIHYNSVADSSVGGTEAWYSSVRPLVDPDKKSQVVSDSKQLATSISSGISGLGLKNRGPKDGDLYVTKNTTMPSVLAEVGFISNKAEYDKMMQDEFQEQLADVIVQSIVDFFNSK